NKDVLTVRLWVTYMLEKFKLISKPKDNMISLSQTIQTVKVSSSIIKVKEIADVSNATIVNCETAKFWRINQRRL
ncbi:6430_t:CDS:2, partial [Funneliformis geosporum]